MIADTGKYLDWYTDMAVKNKWKYMRVVIGPGKSACVGLHPDILRIFYKGGIMFVWVEPEGDLPVKG